MAALARALRGLAGPALRAADSHDRQLLDSVIEALVDPFVVVDASGRIVRANGQIAKMLGATALVLEGKPLHTHLVPNERSKRQNVGAVLKDVQSGRTLTEELTFVAPGVEGVPVLLTGAPLPTGGAVFLARDLRPKLAGEIHMQAIQAQLVQTSKLASLGTLGAGVAHELNNPLAAVRGFAELIASGRVKDDRAVALAEKIVIAADRMRKIIDHLRVFATDTARREKRPVALNAVVNDSLMLLQNQLANRGIALEIDLGRDLPPVSADANGLESVVQNLITNARDAFDALPPERERRIRVRTGRHPSGRLAIVVEDTANGIPAAVQPRVFDPFFTTKEVGKGTGLGLSIAHGIAKDHGGELTFITADGVGTAFTLTLPAAAATEDPEPTPALEPEPAPAPAHRLRLLIVDDEEGVVELLILQLSLDFEVEGFTSPMAAVTRATEQAFDLVITDMAMPGLSGVEVIKAIRLKRPETRFLVMTGHARSETVLAAVGAIGAAGILPKPFPPAAELRAILYRLLADPAGQKIAG